jgi:hypothetical protein
MRPSEFVQKAFCLNGQAFDLSDYPYLPPIYNSKATEINLFTARQVAKSTTLASLLVQTAMTVPRSSQIVVNPLQEQAYVFSTSRLRDFLDSPLVKRLYFSGVGHTDQMLRKTLTNESMITLGYAQRTADRLRGRSVRGIGAYLMFDEIQDILPEVIPVVREMGFRAEAPRYLMAGTPRSLSNHMETCRRQSTAGEWAVRCAATGCKKWNLRWIERNVGKKGVVCEHCSELLDTRRGQWVEARRLNPDKGIFSESYRIPQLIVHPIMSNPAKWRELLVKIAKYSPALLYNEVFGLPYDSAQQPVSMDQLLKCCVPDRPNQLPSTSDMSMPPLVMGVDWAFFGLDSCTFVVIGGWNPFPSRFDVYFAKAFVGEEADVEYQIDWVIRTADACNIRLVGLDWGAGHVQNIKIANALGVERVMQMWHTSRAGKGSASNRVKWDRAGQKWHLARTRVLTDTFESLRRGQTRLPRSEEIQPLINNILAEKLEMRPMLETLFYTHTEPDDGLHALTFAQLAGEYFIRGNFGGHTGMAPVMASSPDSMILDPWDAGDELALYQ